MLLPFPLAQNIKDINQVDSARLMQPANGESVEKMVVTIEDISRGAQEQASAVTQAASLTNRLSENLSQVTQEAKSSASRAAETAQVAQKGAKRLRPH